MATVKKVFTIILDVVLWAVLALSLLITAMVFISQANNGVPSLFGKMPFTVQTASMQPTLMAGDLIIDTKIDSIDELKTEDIITFWTIIDGKKAINTHRIVEVIKNDAGNVASLRTKGDNNQADDTVLVYPADLIGIYSGNKYSGIGGVLDFLRTSKGFLLCIVLPLLLFFLFELCRFIKLLMENQRKKAVAELTEEQKKAAIEEYIKAQNTENPVAADIEAEPAETSSVSENSAEE